MIFGSPIITKAWSLRPKYRQTSETSPAESSSIVSTYSLLSATERPWLLWYSCGFIHLAASVKRVIWMLMVMKFAHNLHGTAGHQLVNNGCGYCFSLPIQGKVQLLVSAARASLPFLPSFSQSMLVVTMSVSITLLQASLLLLQNLLLRPCSLLPGTTHVVRTNIAQALASFSRQSTMNHC